MSTCGLSSPSLFVQQEPLVMVAIVVCNMATHHFTILNGVAQENVAPQCCTAFLAAVVHVVCSFSFRLTF